MEFHVSARIQSLGINKVARCPVQRIAQTNKNIEKVTKTDFEEVIAAVDFSPVFRLRDRKI